MPALIADLKEKCPPTEGMETENCGKNVEMNDYFLLHRSTTDADFPDESMPDSFTHDTKTVINDLISYETTTNLIDLLSYGTTKHSTDDKDEEIRELKLRLSSIEANKDELASKLRSSEAKFKLEIADLTSQNNDLKAKLKSCDATLDAALENLFKLANPDFIEDLKVNLACKDDGGDSCIVIGLQVKFPKSLIDSIKDGSGNVLEPGKIKALLLMDNKRFSCR